jgi:hypothetical protein
MRALLLTLTLAAIMGAVGVLLVYVGFIKANSVPQGVVVALSGAVFIFAATLMALHYVASASL